MRGLPEGVWGLLFCESLVVGRVSRTSTVGTVIGLPLSGLTSPLVAGLASGPALVTGLASGPALVTGLVGSLPLVVGLSSARVIGPSPDLVIGLPGPLVAGLASEPLVTGLASDPLVTGLFMLCLSSPLPMVSFGF